MARKSAARLDRDAEAKAKAEGLEALAQGLLGGDAGSDIPPDCGYCRRSSNCATWLGYNTAVGQALNGYEKRIPGLRLRPTLVVEACPEFEVKPELEESVRKQLAPAAVAAEE